MSDELLKLLLQASVDTLLALTLGIAIYFLSRGRGKATESEAETSKKREENEGKLIDVTTSMASTMSELKDSYAKLVDVETATVEWHKLHDTAIAALSKDVQNRSKLDGEAIEEFRADVDTKYAAINKRIDDNYTDVKKDIGELKALVEKRIPPADCVDLDKQFEAFEERMISRLEKREPVNAVASTTVIIDDVKPPAEPLEGAA